MDEQKKRGLFKGSIAGDPAPRRFTLDGVTANFMPALVGCTLNAGGGMLASAIDHRIDAWKAGAGTLGIALISLALKTVVQPVSELSIAIREVASGMAGWVGDELFDGLVLWWKSETWQSGKVYTKGGLVRHASTFWQAAEDVPAGGSEPGKDGRWLKVTAITYSLSDINECARLILLDKQKSEFLAKFIAGQLGQRRGWQQNEVAGAADDMQKAMSLFAEELSKATK